MNIAALVQNNFVTRTTAPFAEAVRERGIPLFDRSLDPEVPFDFDGCGIDWGEYDHVLVYGSVGLLRRCLKSRLAPFISYDATAFSTSGWAAKLKNRALNANGLLVPLFEVESVIGAGWAHVRPDAEDKAFTGGVYDSETFARLVEDRQHMLTDDLPCWVSPPAEILSEDRCWIVGGEVIEISRYRQKGVRYYERNTRRDVYEAARELASIFHPVENVVMDIANTPDGYKVIEFNPIHGSGWYGADIGHILDHWTSHIRNNSQP